MLQHLVTAYHADPNQPSKIVSKTHGLGECGCGARQYVWVIRKLHPQAGVFWELYCGFWHANLPTSSASWPTFELRHNNLFQTHLPRTCMCSRTDGRRCKLPLSTATLMWSSTSARNATSTVKRLSRLSVFHNLPRHPAVLVLILAVKCSSMMEKFALRSRSLQSGTTSTLFVISPRHNI